MIIGIFLPSCKAGAATVSIPTPIPSRPGDNAETLIARADNALYRAKMNGRNRAELAPLPDRVTSDAASVA